MKEAILRGTRICGQSRKLLTGMASALAHVHERGFLHSISKPEKSL